MELARGPHACDRSGVSEAPIPHAPDRVSAAALRTALHELGYEAPQIQARLGSGDELLMRTSDIPVHVRRLGEEDALALLLRLFLLGLPTPLATVKRVVAPELLELLGRCRLLGRADGELRATARLVPHDELLIASDYPDPGGRADHVPGVQRPSATLSHLTVRQPVTCALDVGTGNGIQAILAATHADRVVATDVNERALAFAAFNAALNGVENVELRRGSFFEPVEGERFGLVVCNPPYVISPESAYLFRDSGLGRDAVSAELVERLPAFLEEGGFASITVSWVQEGDDPTTTPRRWLERSGCDFWIFHTGSEDPLTSAAGWNSAATDDPEAYGQAIDRWVEYFRSEGIEAIAYGCLVLRRRSGGPTWGRATQLPRRVRSRASEQLERLFAAQDYLARLPSEERLLEARLRLVERAVLEQAHRLEDGRWEEEAATLRLDEGLEFKASLDETTVRIVSALDGATPLQEALERIAAEDGPSRDDVLEAGTRLARQMLELGFVVPVEA